MSDSSNLDIKITTTADTAGAKQASAALKGTGEAAKATGKGLTTEIGGNAKRSVEGLNRAFEGVNQAMQGGAWLARGLGTAIGGIFQAAGKFAWVGLLINAVGIAIAVIGRLKEAFGQLGQKGEEEAKRSADAWVAGMERAAQAGDTKLADYFKEIARSAAEARTEIDAVTAAIIAQTDADEAVAVAQIDADEALSNSQKLEAKAAVRATYREGRVQTRLSGMDEQEAKQAGTVQAAQAGAGMAETELERRRKVVTYLEERDPAKLEAEREVLNVERRNSRSTVARQGGGEMDVWDLEKRLTAQIEDLDAQIALGGKDGEAWKARRDQAAAAVPKAEAGVDAARRLAEEEARKLETLRKDNARERHVITRVAASQQTVDTVSTGTQIKEARKAEAEKAAKPAALPAAAVPGGDWQARADVTGRNLAQEGQRLGGTNAATANPAFARAADTLAQAGEALQGEATVAELARAADTVATVATQIQALGGVPAEVQRLARALDTLQRQLATVDSRTRADRR